ncbi:Flagellar L-ring protein [bioreactor metagenome]|uniref:Flagellar L-ring protein n=1 Tax=bioreactor metagenome TaxID=1076179 RepID=A0A645GB82_9ZZZZ
MRSLTKSFVCYIVLGFLIAAMPITTKADAASLWSDNANLYADHKARGVGDILTILINESSSASRAGKANNSKSASAGASAGTGIFRWIAGADFESEDSFNAQGSISNTNKVNAKMTARVIEVQPNGNLVVTGTQSIKQNGEEQKITVTGVVRPDDVTADNTVLSSYVADAQIRIDGHGPISGKQRQGILTQIFNFLF